MHHFFFSISTIYFQLNWEPGHFCLLAIKLLSLSCKNVLTLLGGKIPHHPEKWLHHHLLSIDGMRKVCKVWMYTCAFFCHLPWSLQAHVIINCGNLLVFFRQSSSYVLLCMHGTKHFSIISLDNADSGFITEYHFYPIIHSPWLLLFSPL